MTRHLRPVLGFGALLVLSLTAVSMGQAQTTPSQVPKKPAQVMDQMTNIPYFTLRDGMSSTLTLNNVGPTSTPVAVTIYNTEGKAQELKPITLPPHSFKQIELRDVVVSDEFSSGNIEVAYNGISMGLTCQVSVSNPDKRVSFESRDVWGQQEMQDMMPVMSSNLSGILWLPQESAEGFLAVTNIGKNKTTVQVSTGSKPQTITLYSRETKLMNLSEGDGQRGPGASLVKMQNNGVPGDIITTGFVLDLKRGYSSAFTMLDPGLMVSSHLAGAHLRIGKPDPSEGFPEGTRFRSPLLLANIGAKPVKAHVSVDYTVQKKLEMSRWDDKESTDNKGSTEEQFSTIKVADLTIRPDDVARVELSDAFETLGINRITEAGVDIDYDAPPGTLNGHLVSVDQSGDYSFEVPIKDPAGMTEMMEGIYPWTLETGNDTVLHLKNTTNSSVTGLLLLDYYDNGVFKTYHPSGITLKPYQTVAIDIQKLKDSKKQDARGQIISANVMSGQAQWRQETPYSIIGRAEQTNVKEGIAKSFSCGYSCCSFYTEIDYLSPSILTGAPTNTGTLVATKEGIGCNDIDYGPEADTDTVSWASGNTSVATDNYTSGAQPSVTVTYVAAGTTNVSASMSYYWYDDGGTCSCHGHQSFTPRSAGVNVVSISMDKSSLWYFGNGISAPSDFTLGSTSATPTANGLSTGTFQWTVASGSTKIKFENGSSTITKTNSNTVGITTTLYSTSANDIAIQLQYTPSGGTATSFYYYLQVDSPYKFQVNTPDFIDFGIEYTCNDITGTNGYVSYIEYLLESFFGVTMAHSYVNESFGTRINDYSGNTYGTPSAGSRETSDGSLADMVCQGGSESPQPLPPQSPLGSTLIFHIPQSWFVGSLTSGSGVEVQTDTVDFYQDHGRHTGITSSVR